MDAAVVDKSVRLLPALAAKIAEWFPDLEGRSLAVSDARLTKDNLPTLPLVMVAFAREASGQPPNSRRTQFQLDTYFVVEFWMKPERYKRADNTETPFWSFYDYESIRNRLLSKLSNWLGPQQERISYQTMTIETDALAVIVTMQFIATWDWCDDADDLQAELELELGDGLPVTPATFMVKLCTPRSAVCPEAFEEPVDETKCPPVVIGPNYS